MMMQVIADGDRDCYYTEALMGPPDVETADPRSHDRDGPGPGEGERLSYYMERDRGRSLRQCNMSLFHYLFDAMGLIFFSLVWSGLVWYGKYVLMSLSVLY